MRPLAARLGLSAPALYHHFPNREAILESISEEGFKLLVSRLEELPATRWPARQCSAILRVYREFALDEPHLFGAMFLMRRPRARRFPKDFVAKKSAAFAFLVDCVEQAMQARELRKDDANEAAMTLWAHAHGLILLQRAGRFDGPLAVYRRAFDRSIERLFAGLKNKRSL